MLRMVLAAGVLAGALAASPAVAQQQSPPAAREGANVVGLSVYSTDGQKLGEITAEGVAGGQRMLQAEMGSFLGLGPSPVLIPEGMFEHKADRIEVAMTAAQVKDSLARQKSQQ